MRPTYLTINTSLVRENLRKIKIVYRNGAHLPLLSRLMAMATAVL